MKKFYCHFFLWIILIANSAVFANGICNISGVWVAYSPPVMTGFALLQEGDSTISGWWFPYPASCDRPVVLGTIQGNGQIFLQGYSSKNAGCEVLTMTAVIDSYNCDFAVVDLWSSTGEVGRYLYQKFPSHIEFTEPQKNTVFVISKEPKMPNINAAVMIEYGEQFQRLIKQSSSLPFVWDINIESTPRPGRIIKSAIPLIFTANKEYNVDFSLLQDLPFDDGPVSSVRGGKLSIVVHYENGLSAKGHYEIQGTNPGKELIEQVLTDPVSRGIACTESSYRQFNAKREGGVGMPVLGGKKGQECGIGLMQLCLPAPYNSSVWNWQENINEAMKLLNEKRNDARKAHITERTKLNEEREAMGLSVCPVGTPLPLTLEQENRETLRRYNCGREYRWEPRDAKDCAGQWVIKPTLPKICKDYGYVDKVLNCKIP